MSKTTTFEAWVVIRRKKIANLRFFRDRSTAEFYAAEWSAPHHRTRIERVRVTVEVIEEG